MISLDGELHEGNVAPFDLTDRGLTLADGLFETMTLFGGTVFRLDAHLDRLDHGLKVLGFSVERDRLYADIIRIAGHEPPDGAVLRLTVTRGPGARGLAPPADPVPTVMLSLSGFRRELVFEPTTLFTSSIRRNDGSPLARLKSLQYLDNVLALREAVSKGAKDALMLNSQLRVACTTAANVFCIADGHLFTPPIRDGVLPGIIRSIVLAAAADLGLKPVEKSLTARDLVSSGTVFLTNSVRLVQPVTTIDNSRLAGDQPLVRAILDRVLDVIVQECGVDPVRL
ncbi:aminotransferase class IV [Chthonobacter rhizosphaerae]|uniref:aminotransferase class IV n=1 Tax=Chthonobacter rhizosphaerae TaxID=2735553 RepID=UPI0015EF37CA|nr:aminotransferase class IV [Chthonobacter rhizosphaerae]